MAEKKEKKTTKQKKDNDGIILVGQKPPMSYVLAVVTHFNENGSKDVTIKARGKSITTAVDTAEIARNRFVKNVKIKDIKIGTDSVKNEKGIDKNVSSIEITLTTA